MKKILLLAALGIFSFNTAHSQEIGFGIKGGLNLSNLSIKQDDVSKPDSRTSFHIGGLVEIPISGKFSIQPELLFSMQGAQEEESETYMGQTYSSKTTLKLNYINLPIMAKYYVVDGLALEVGPQFGFLMSAKGEFEASGPGIDETGTIDLKEEVKTLDMGVAFGASYELNLGVFFSARYNIGLSNINKDNDEDFDESSNVKNRVFQVSIGYMF